MARWIIDDLPNHFHWNYREVHHTWRAFMIGSRTSQNDGQIVELRKGATICRLAPHLGGAILSLSLAGAEILRQTPAGSTEILDTACFPLVPFANRIAGGRFSFDGRQVTLPADAATPPHAHHGHGWRRPWQVTDLSAASATIEYTHQADSWPWSYRARQRLSVIDAGLEIELEVTNLSDRMMPCGFGLHPYFQARASSYIVIDAPECLRPDDRGIPSIAGAGLVGHQSLSALGDWDALLLDESGRLLIGTKDWEIEMIANQSVGWQFYLPPERPYFCVEPVSHIPNILDRFEGQDVLQPGCSRRWTALIQRTQ